MPMVAIRTMGREILVLSSLLRMRCDMKDEIFKLIRAPKVYWAWSLKIEVLNDFHYIFAPYEMASFFIRRLFVDFVQHGSSASDSHESAGVQQKHQNWC